MTAMTCQLTVSDNQYTATATMSVSRFWAEQVGYCPSGGPINTLSYFTSNSTAAGDNLAALMGWTDPKGSQPPLPVHSNPPYSGPWISTRSEVIGDQCGAFNPSVTCPGGDYTATLATWMQNLYANVPGAAGIKNFQLWIDPDAGGVGTGYNMVGVAAPSGLPAGPIYKNVVSSWFATNFQTYNFARVFNDNTYAEALNPNGPPSCTPGPHVFTANGTWPADNCAVHDVILVGAAGNSANAAGYGADTAGGVGASGATVYLTGLTGDMGTIPIPGSWEGAAATGSVQIGAAGGGQSTGNNSSLKQWAMLATGTSLSALSGANAYPNAQFNATIAGTVLTVNASPAPVGTIAVGATVLGTGVTAASTITSLGTGSGGVGTYNLNNSSTVSTAETMETSGSGVAGTPSCAVPSSLSFNDGGYQGLVCNKGASGITPSLIAGAGGAGGSSAASLIHAGYQGASSNGGGQGGAGTAANGVASTTTTGGTGGLNLDGTTGGPGGGQSTNGSAPGGGGGGTGVTVTFGGIGQPGHNDTEFATLTNACPAAGPGGGGGGGGGSKAPSADTPTGPGSGGAGGLYGGSGAGGGSLISSAGMPSFTATISGTVMTVTGTVTNPTINVGMGINGAGVTMGTYVVSDGTGTGNAGTYNLNVASTVPSGETMTTGGAAGASASGYICIYGYRDNALGY